MKNIIMILGLFTIVSCGVNPAKRLKTDDWKDECIKTLEIGDSCKNPTEPEYKVMTDIETITYGTDPVYTFDKVTALGLLKFKTETINFGGGFGEGRREILINENGELLFNIWIGTGANAELYHSNSTTWSFEENDLLIDGASIIYTTI